MENSQKYVKSRRKLLYMSKVIENVFYLLDKKGIKYESHYCMNEESLINKIKELVETSKDNNLKLTASVLEFVIDVE